jgi:hypothetical protein
MKSINLLFLIVVATYSSTLAQTDTDFLHKRNILERLAIEQGVLASGTIPNLPSRPPEIQGDVYLTKEFQFCSFELYKESKVFSRCWAKYDVHSNSFDLIQPEGIRSLPGNIVKSAILNDSITKIAHYFFNANQFKNSAKKPDAGFFELLSEGKIPLLKKVSVEFIMANFSPALNVGSKDHKYVKHIDYFFLKSGNLEKLPKKKLELIFEDNKEAMSAFIKSKNLKNENDLIEIFNYYNSVNN